MKNRLISLFIGLSALTLVTACSQETPVQEKTSNASAPQTEAMQSEQAQTAGAQQAANRSGTVVETMDAMNYTYLMVDTGEETFWAATTQTPVKVGDAVLVPSGTPMPNFHSKELDRTFDMIYFVPSVVVNGDTPAAVAQALPEGHPGTPGGSTKVTATDVDLSGIEPAEGGVTVAEVHANKADLAGKEIKFRGKVVKFSPQIMKKNWLHIQDGTGENGTSDLTVTTDAQAEVGDTVLITGVLKTDVDFGYGYKYDVLVEDANVTKE